MTHCRPSPTVVLTRTDVIALQLRVFRPFFISVDLPYSVRRGEIVAVPVVVFNYLSKDVTADVTLENIGQFDFADYSNEVKDSSELYRPRLNVNWFGRGQYGGTRPTVCIRNCLQNWNCTNGNR